MKPTKLFPAEHAVVVYYHSPEFGVTLDDLLKPDYWTHVATQLRAGHRIEVMAGDGSWWAMLLVRDAGRLQAVVQVLQHVALGTGVELPAAPSGYDIKFRGPVGKWSVVRKTDGEVIRDGMLKDQAQNWLKNHLQSLAA